MNTPEDRTLIERLSSFDKFLVYFILLNLLVIRYLKSTYPVIGLVFNFTVIDIALVGYLLLRCLHMRLKFGVTFYLSSLFLVTMIGLNGWKYGIGPIAVENLIAALSPSSLILFILYLRKVYSQNAFHQLFIGLRKFMNAYFFVNTIIILIQIQTGTFMLTQFLTINPHAFDHFDGLIGLNGVSVLNFVWIVGLLLNIYSYYYDRKVRLLWLSFVQIGFMVYISALNDNKMLFMTFGVFGVMGVLVYLVRDRFSLPAVAKVVILGGLALGILLVAQNSFTSSYESNSASSSLNQFIYDRYNAPSPHNERAYINYLAFRYYDAQHLGYGINRVDMATQQIHIHLGINSSSLLLIQGGVYYLMAVLMFYTSLIAKLFKERNMFLRTLLYAGIFLTMFVTAFASQPFKDHYVFIALLFTFLILFVFGTYAPIPKFVRSPVNDPIKATKGLLT